jgi:hypothetical protein
MRFKSKKGSFRPLRVRTVSKGNTMLKAFFVATMLTSALAAEPAPMEHHHHHHHHDDGGRN